MKYIPIVIVLMLAFIGCDPVKELDWDRTAKEQRLRIGNRIKVDGLAFGLPVYELKDMWVQKSRSIELNSMWVKKNWGIELDLWTYNPDALVDENNPHNPKNPNVPIGAVICTIYNPSYNETLKRLWDIYPDTAKLGASPFKKHRFEIVGRIHSFKRAVRPTADDTQPDISLTAVRIHVENLRLIE